MAHRIFNFNPGPATLPLEVLEQAQAEFLDYRGTGMSIMESSHRSPEYDEINERVISLARDIMGLDDRFHVLFLQGGASTQFSMVPMNFLKKGETAVYVDTGTWSTKAIKEAKRVGNVHIGASSKPENYTRIPLLKEISFPSDAAYLHITTNNTIAGTQYHRLPVTGKVPLIADMSSDICSRQIDFTQFGLFYAGAQKNLGPSGVTLVVIRDDLLAKCPEDPSGPLPTMLNYQTHAKKKSLFNTPPSFSVYLVKLIFEWIQKQGGLAAIEAKNQQKKNLIYGLMDAHPEYFRGPVEEDSRSWMNITMRLPSETLEQSLIAQAKEAGFIGLKGHRSVGGIRVSLYNAMPMKGAEKLAEFLDTFRKNNPA